MTTAPTEMTGPPTADKSRPKHRREPTVTLDAAGAAELEARQLETILRHIATASVTSTLFALALSIFLAPTIGPVAAHAWFVVKLVVAGPRFAMGRYFTRTGRFPLYPRTRNTLFVLFAIDGLVWAAAGVWGSREAPETAILVLACLTTICAIATLGIQTDLKATAACVVPVLAPSVIAFAVRGDALGLFGACAGAFILAQVLLSSRGSERRLKLEIHTRRQWEASVAERSAIAQEAARVEAMRETLVARSVFLAKVSHELRSPIQSIVSSLDVLEMRSDRATDDPLIRRIRRSSLLLNTQLRDLLTLAKSEAGQLTMHPAVFEAGAMVEAIAASTRDLAKVNEIALVCRIPEEPAFVVADGPRVDQIVTNLLVNAIRYTEVGTVSVTLHPFSAEARRLVFEVADTGPGLSDEALAVLHDPAVASARADSRTSESSGLGLAIVGTLVQLLGGTVNARPGIPSGTVIRIEIPAEPADDPGTSPHATHRILIVDDLEDVREALASVANDLGLECDLAASSAVAANLLAARRYDAVLLDLEMPRKSGVETAMEVRRGDGPNRDAKFIGMSAGEPSQDVRAAFDAWLGKPIRRSSLRQVLGLTDSDFRPSQPGLWAEGP